ncbi:MAG: hypothetical protein PHP14_02375 [Candidatus Pacebacteria bacterium]|nr:hypothetical protein [Candidatus Paceibacterota bacterium]
MKKIPKSFIFLFTVLIIYLIVFFIKPTLIYSSLQMFNKIIIQFSYAFIVIFILTFLSNKYITKEFILKYFNKKGFKKWFFIILAGIFATGPIYIWYPLLQEFQQKGLKIGFIACFLYNQAIKIFLLPILLIYFDIKYVIILTVVMIVMSILQGLIINRLIKNQNEKNI